MFDEVAQVISTALNIEKSLINEDFSQNACANWDSLRHLNLMFLLEEKYDVSFEPEEIAEMLDVKSIIKAIRDKQK